MRGPGGRESAATASTCFSFESDISRGLRSESVVTDGDGAVFVRICCEYSLVGDYDALVVTHRIITEGGRPEYALCAFAIPISRRRGLTIAGRFSDGSGYGHDVGPKSPLTVLWGEAFRIAAGADVLSIVPVSETGRPFVWQLSLLDRPDRRIVTGGRYVLGQPAEHTLCMLLVPGEDDGRLVDRALNRRLPPAIVTEIEAGVTAGRTTTSRGSSGAPVPQGA